MAHEFDPFALSSGLPLADTNCTVTAVDFKFDTSYSADACVAAITFQPDDEGQEPQEQLYSCGKGWEPLDRGRAVGHTSGRSVNFNGQSNYGKFLAAAFACEGFLDEARASGFTPQQAELLEGRRFHLTAQITHTINPSKPTDPPKEKSLIVPDEYLGSGDDEAPAPAKAAASTAKKAPAPRTGAAAKPAAAAPAGGSAIERKQIALVEQLAAENEELLEQMRELLGDADSHESFMEAAMELPGVADSELAQQVAMSSKPGSLWASRE